MTNNIYNISRLQQCLDDIYHLNRTYDLGPDSVVPYDLPKYWLVSDGYFQRCKTRWTIFSIPRKGSREFDTSTKYRIICSPCSTLRTFLRVLKIFLESIYHPRPQATAYCKGGGIVVNAQRHIGQKFVYNLDLKDFFFHINENMIKDRLLKSPFKFRSQVAEAIAKVCCVQISDKLEKRWGHFLPQGSPVSPLL